MVPWDDKVPKFTYNPGGEASSLFVPTVETTRLSYFLDSLVANRCATWLCIPCLHAAVLMHAAWLHAAACSNLLLSEPLVHLHCQPNLACRRQPPVC